MGDRLNYWEGKAWFTPPASEIEVFVDGSAYDDMERQPQFYKTICEEWPILSRGMEGELLRSWSEWNPKGDATSASPAFKISSLSIPRTSIENAEWETWFSTVLDRDRLFTLYMRGRVPIFTVVDG
jgi:hypothetical protein